MPIGAYTPPPGKSLHKIFFHFFLFYFYHFRCILLQISHKKCFFVSISILGRSRVKREIAIAGHTGHVTRSGNRACFVPRVNSFAIKSFFYTGIKQWNALSSATQLISNKQAFKSEVKKTVMDETYSIG